MRTLFRAFIAAAPIAAAAGVLGFASLISPADAWERSQQVRPHAAETIKLGYVTGVAYYTLEADGYHVVATLSVADGAPVRFAATLQPEQSVTISVPGAEGDTPKSIEIARKGETVTVTRPLRLVLN
ncbi:hypothetical protein [Bosea sp. 117]|uniref:hypothetical protein n=1 Tax=Bosea sp. 117 TaxID=1125973 RepID=UPI000493DE10|nr:hypothetical protein [Bosea sp. 117]